MKPRLRRILLILAGAYALVCALMYVQQQRLIYVPMAGPTLPAEAGLLGFTDHTIGSLRIWADTPSDEPILIYLHGNGGGLFKFVPALEYLAKHYEVLALEYPGYPRGGPGSPSEKAIVHDAVALFDYARDKYPNRKIIIWGYSLGSGVATQLAAQRTADALVLEAPFTAVVDRAAELFPYLPTRWMVRDRYLSRSMIAKNKAPLFIMHGTNDPVIPLAHGEALYEVAGEPKQIQRYTDADHWNLREYGAYDDAVEFITQALAR